MIAIIASFFRIISILYTYKMFLPKYKFPKNHLSRLAILFLSLFIISVFTYKHSDSLFILLCTFFIMFIYETKFDHAFVFTTISYTFYCLLGNPSTLIITLILSSFYIQNQSFPFTLALLLANILTLVLLILFFRIKRLRNGLSLFSNQKFIRIAIIFCVLTLSTKTIGYLFTEEKHYQNSIHYGVPLFIIIFLLSLVLYNWYRNQITKTYIEKLRQLEIQSLYDELAQKDKQIQKLTDDNESLARIIHKDNKLIPAMEHAVEEFLSRSASQDMQSQGALLTKQLHTMSQDRKGVLDLYQSKNTHLNQTGHVGIDAVLAYMQKKANANHITFECRHTKESIDRLLERISHEDIAHLLSDLLENAIIAMQNTNDGKLQVIFGILKNEAYISIADNGTPFDIETLHSFGIHKHTTHADTGGSGIGLMDIWNLKKKYRASIQIQEYENEKFTKKIIFFMNSKNHYVIQSYRYLDIINAQTRGDLYVIPAENNTEIGGKAV